MKRVVRIWFPETITPSVRWQETRDLDAGQKANRRLQVILGGPDVHIIKVAYQNLELGYCTLTCLRMHALRA